MPVILREGVRPEKAFKESWPSGERWWKKVEGHWFATADHKGPFVGVYPEDQVPKAIREAYERWEAETGLRPVVQAASPSKQQLLADCYRGDLEGDLA